MSQPSAKSASPIRVLIADDDLSILETMTEALSVEPGFTVVGAALTPGEAIRVAKLKCPDVAVIDVRMPDGGGVRAIQEIVEDCPQTCVVALSAYADQETVLRMLRVGATSYLVKGMEVGELYEAIRGAAAGISVIAPEVASDLGSDRSTRSRTGGLPPAAVSRKDRIRHVVKSRAFTMFFQPIVDLLGGATAGFEALARFPLEPVRGPEGWFADAHAEGLGVDLELACIRAALTRIAFFPPSCYLSVNLSPVTAASDRLPVVLGDAPPDQLVLEVTEHAAVEDYDELNEALERLSLGGLRLAIDDVGAGFSSLRHLLSLRPDFIKIDRSLCRHVNTAPGRVLLEGLVSFATEVGATVIAEGIETTEELDGLRDVGVRFGQGYLLGVPAPMSRRRGHRRRPRPHNAQTLAFLQRAQAATAGKRAGATDLLGPVAR